MNEAHLSRGATGLQKLLRWYVSRNIPFPDQKKLAEHRKVGERQLRRYLAELERCCTDRCPDHCDGIKETGHVGLVEVKQRGDGRAASYTLNVRTDVRADVRAEIKVASPQLTPNAEVTDENVRAETPYLSSLSSSCISHPPGEQHYSPLVKNAAEEKPSPEAQTKNPKPGSGGKPGPAFDSEVAEIREALKVRPLVRLTAAFDPVIREMLASGETVETIKRAILRGCWLKLACRDQASRRGLHDASLIFSMRYFLDVIAQVRPMADLGYWRNIERRLGREEQAWLSRQTSSDGREHGTRALVSAPAGLLGEKVA